MKEKKLIDIMKTAIQTELDGIQFYEMAAQRTGDKKGKDVFLLLASDEKKHFDELLRHYKSILKSSKWSSAVSLGGETFKFEGESPIFSEEFKTRIKDKHFEMSALSIGALLETNSITFYRKVKEETEDPIARELFEKLQRWEQVHLEAITKQLDVLKEEYWADQHFTPLF